MNKRLILVVLVVSAILVGACSFSSFTLGSRTLRGSGNVVTETRQVSDFTLAIPARSEDPAGLKLKPLMSRSGGFICQQCYSFSK